MLVSRESHTKAKDPLLRERAHAAIWDLGKARGIIWRYDIQLSAQRRPHHNNNTTTAERKDCSRAHAIWRVLGSSWSHKNNTTPRTQLCSQHGKEQATGGIPLLPYLPPDLTFLRPPLVTRYSWMISHNRCRYLVDSNPLRGYTQPISTADR